MSTPKFTYKNMMVGKLSRDEKHPPKSSACFPRKGGQKIKLKPVDKKVQWALILKQNGV